MTHTAIASKTTVRNIVASLMDTSKARRWLDKCAKGPEYRKLAIRFDTRRTEEADIVAAQLQARLREQGYSNEVKRTSVASCYATRTEGGEYIRVLVTN